MVRSTSHTGTRAPVPARVVARFLVRTDYGALQVARVKTPCDLWTGSVNNAGYGQLCWVDDGKRFVIGAHVLALRLDHFAGFRRELRLEADNHGGRDLFEVAHACDVRRCVNPAHLELVSQAENMAQMRQRGSQRRQADVMRRAFGAPSYAVPGPGWQEERA